jgi:hypothetical protein
MFGLKRMSSKRKVGAVLGAIAWALVGISMAKMFGGDLESQLLVAVCDATAGALVWLAFDAPPSHNRGYIHQADVYVAEAANEGRAQVKR